MPRRPAGHLPPIPTQCCAQTDPPLCSPQPLSSSQPFLVVSDSAGSSSFLFPAPLSALSLSASSVDGAPGVSPSIHSTISHSMDQLPSRLVPADLFMVSNLDPETMLSNHGTPGPRSPCAACSTLSAVSDSPSASPGITPSSSRSRRSSSSNAPSVRDMKSLSSGGFSDQYESGVPQKPQKWRSDDGSSGEVYTRRIV